MCKEPIVATYSINETSILLPTAKTTKTQWGKKKGKTSHLSCALKCVLFDKLLFFLFSFPC